MTIIATSIGAGASLTPSFSGWRGQVRGVLSMVLAKVAASATGRNAVGPRVTR